MMLSTAIVTFNCRYLQSTGCIYGRGLAQVTCFLSRLEYRHTSRKLAIYTGWIFILFCFFSFIAFYQWDSRQIASKIELFNKLLTKYGNIGIILQYWNNIGSDDSHFGQICGYLNGMEVCKDKIFLQTWKKSSRFAGNCETKQFFVVLTPQIIKASPVTLQNGAFTGTF